MGWSVSEKVGKGFQLLAVFANCSVLDVWRDSKYTCGYTWVSVEGAWLFVLGSVYMRAGRGQQTRSENYRNFFTFFLLHLYEAGTLFIPCRHSSCDNIFQIKKVSSYFFFIYNNERHVCFFYILKKQPTKKKIFPKVYKHIKNYLYINSQH